MTGKFEEYKQQCAKTLDHFKKDLTRMRTGRASAALLEGVQVEYYGSSVPLQQLGLVAAPEPRLLTIQVYDASAVESIEKAIQQADLGLNPARDGSMIRVAIPALNEERRKDMIKKLHKMAEDTKVTMRNHRRDALEALKKDQKNKTISEDDARRGQEEIQKIIDKFVADVDSALTAKEKEMMEV